MKSDKEALSEINDDSGFSWKGVILIGVILIVIIVLRFGFCYKAGI